MHEDVMMRSLLIVVMIWVITGFLFWVWMKLGKRMGSLMKENVVCSSTTCYYLREARPYQNR